MGQIKEPLQQQHPGRPPVPFNHAGALWATVIATLAFGVIYSALPENVTLGPSWIPLAIEAILLLPLILLHAMRRPPSQKIIHTVKLISLSVITTALAIGVTLLVYTLPRRSQAQAGSLLRTSALLWIANIIVFALWYWEIDGGGPRKRHAAGHKAADLMFPQQADGNTQGWVPHFIDYFFVAFTGATAFSPTDTYPLTHMAKILMMVEAVIAFTILAILVGRAVNIL